MGKKKTRNESPAFMGFYFCARNEDKWLQEHVTPQTDGLQKESAVWRQEKPEIGRHKLTFRRPSSLFNKENYNVRVPPVENWTRVKTTLENVIGFDLKDLVPRNTGAWHGREPGPVKPKLVWKRDFR